MSVFISYRRKGGSRIASKIYRALSTEYQVFWDKKSLKSGRYDTALIDNVQECTDFVLIVTKHTFDRCDDPNDWITNELKTALSDPQKNIIPIFVGVKTFPQNVPESLRQLNDNLFCNLQAVKWKSGKSIKDLQGYLKSNKLCALSVIRKDQQVGLSEKSKQELIALYKKFQVDQHQGIIDRGVDISLNIANEQDFSALFLSHYTDRNSSDDMAKKLAIQEQKRRYLNEKRLLEIAIKQLLSDRMIDSCARDQREDYVKKHGLDQCYCTYADGVEDYCVTPFAWMEIIEELLKQLVFDRALHYANARASSIPVDFVAKNKLGAEIWSFHSFLDKKALEGADSLEETLQCCRGDFWDIPKNDLFSHVFPDFYYNLALLKEGKSSLRVNMLPNYNSIFEITKYFIGFR